MSRTRWMALAVGAMILGGLAPDADAFGKGFARRRAKRRAKEEAKKAAMREIQKETGVNVGAIASGNAGAIARSAASHALAGEYAPYVGMSPAAIRSAVQADIYKQRRITRFSRREDIGAADRMVNSRVDTILGALKAARIAGAAGGVNKGNVGMAAHMAAEKAVAARNLSAAGHASATAHAHAAANSAVHRPAARAVARAVVKQDPAVLRARIKDEVYAQQRINRFSKREDRVRADLIVDQRVKDALAAAAPPPPAPPKPPPVSKAAGHLMQETPAQVRARIKKEVYREQRINEFSARIMKMRADREVDRRVAAILGN